MKKNIEDVEADNLRKTYIREARTEGNFKS